jgi:predicted O-methyltransferase YrrM
VSFHVIPSVEDYAEAFEAERQRQYLAVDAVVARHNYALDRLKLETAARILACPIKAHAPNWQHGRVLYAVARAYLATRPGPVTALDVGTAKGFSALCLQWALDDAGNRGDVFSVDVIDPQARVRRNTVAEVDGFKTLREILSFWPESTRIAFQRMAGADWLKQFDQRVHLAFLDGKHTEEAVATEGILLAKHQEPGDVVVFDDVQIDGVARALKALRSYYDLETVRVNAERQHAIGVRRG